MFVKYVFKFDKHHILVNTNIKPNAYCPMKGNLTQKVCFSLACWAAVAKIKIIIVIIINTDGLGRQF